MGASRLLAVCLEEGRTVGCFAYAFCWLCSASSRRAYQHYNRNAERQGGKQTRERGEGAAWPNDRSSREELIERCLQGMCSVGSSVHLSAVRNAWRNQAT
mmetsp:Transcript_12523/g.24345  ORF Transcript_12523/g.24345 Transcript_12523/m.24345 type:complete len:100 (+) Transcript_12523:349-648(+)